MFTDDWIPTSANINALPKPLKSFIHELETFQYSEMIQDNFGLRQNLEVCEAVIEDLKVQIIKIKESQ